MATGKEIVASVIGLVLSLYVIANLAPDAISSILNANVTGWGTSIANLFQTVIPVMAVIGLVVLVISTVYDNM